MSSKINLKKDLEKASKIKNHATRAVSIAVVIAEALRQIDQDPILVGGAAVEFYTQGGYATDDIDMVTYGGPQLIQCMQELGFEKLGKDFVHKKLKIYIEFPGRSLNPTEKTNMIKIKDKTLRIISIEDLIVDRLCAFKYWKSAIDGINALLLMEGLDLDLPHLKTRAEEEDVVDALTLVGDTYQEIVRKKLSHKQASLLIKQAIQKLS